MGTRRSDASRYWIVAPVTQAEYHRTIQANPASGSLPQNIVEWQRPGWSLLERHQWERPALILVVSWHDAVAYCGVGSKRL